jgi:hypothetical protein
LLLGFLALASAVAMARSLSLFHPNQRIVISTEAAHALGERRSGEICFSTTPFRAHTAY